MPPLVHLQTAVPSTLTLAGIELVNPAEPAFPATRQRRGCVSTFSYTFPDLELPEETPEERRRARRLYEIDNDTDSSAYYQKGDAGFTSEGEGIVDFASELGEELDGIHNSSSQGQQSFSLISDLSSNENESSASENRVALSARTKYSPVTLPNLPSFNYLRNLQAQLKTLHVKTFRPVFPTPFGVSDLANMPRFQNRRCVAKPLRYRSARDSSPEAWVVDLKESSESRAMSFISFSFHDKNRREVEAPERFPEGCRCM